MPITSIGETGGAAEELSPAATPEEPSLVATPERPFLAATPDVVPALAVAKSRGDDSAFMAAGVSSVGGSGGR